VTAVTASDAGSEHARRTVDTEAPPIPQCVSRSCRSGQVLTSEGGPGPSCVPPRAPHLKREWSLWPEFGLGPGNPRELSKVGAGWCQALSDCSVDPGFDVARRVLASLRDRHSGPPMMGSEGCGGPISRYVLAVRLTAGIKTRNGLASSIVPAGTSLHRVGGIQFSPIAIVHN